jgi:hypothetical protein
VSGYGKAVPRKSGVSHLPGPDVHGNLMTISYDYVINIADHSYENILID